jgi:hypothetical protein
MKKKLLMAGILVVLMAFTLTMSGCDLFGSGATVIVQNVSTFSADAQVYVDISSANNASNVVRSQYSVGRNQQVTFTGVPTGVSYRVWVIDNNGNGWAWSSAAFTLSAGETATFIYTGLAITRQ